MRFWTSGHHQKGKPRDNQPHLRRENRHPRSRRRRKPFLTKLSRRHRRPARRHRRQCARLGHHGDRQVLHQRTGLGLARRPQRADAVVYRAGPGIAGPHAHLPPAHRRRGRRPRLRRRGNVGRGPRFSGDARRPRLLLFSRGGHQHPLHTWHGRADPGQACAADSSRLDDHRPTLRRHRRGEHRNRRRHRGRGSRDRRGGRPAPPAQREKPTDARRDKADYVHPGCHRAHRRDDMTDLIDRTKMFRLLEERIAKTTNPRHLLMLNRVLQHAQGEADLDLDLVMSTLSTDPRYVAWGAAADMSPVGRQAVRTFYEGTIVKGGQFFLEFDMDRIVVDDDTIVTEGNFRSLYYGADAAQRGFPVDDPEGFYLLSLRMLIVWPFDAEGFIIGEESYSAVTTPDFLKKVEISQVPQELRDF